MNDVTRSSPDPAWALSDLSLSRPGPGPAWAAPDPSPSGPGSGLAYLSRAPAAAALRREPSWAELTGRPGPASAAAADPWLSDDPAPTDRHLDAAAHRPPTAVTDAGARPAPAFPAPSSALRLLGSPGGPPLGAAGLAGPVDRPPPGAVWLAGPVDRPPPDAVGLTGPVDRPPPGAVELPGSLGGPPLGAAGLAGPVDRPPPEAAGLAEPVDRPPQGAMELAGPGGGSASGVGRLPGAVGGSGLGAVRAHGVVGGWPAGQVVTWLPDGRWVAADAGAEDDTAAPDGRPAAADPGAAARRRGERRIALARVGARLGGWPRRVVVAVLLLAAVLLAARPHPAAVTAAPAPPVAEVVVAARDLAAGTVLAAADLRTVSMPVAVVPTGVARRPAGLVGRLAAGAIRRGETVTDARVVGPGLTAGLRPGEAAAVPVRLADPDSAALVRAGDRVDVLGTPVAPDGTQPAAGDAVDVATGVRVLAVLGGRDAADGVVLVVAATQQTARHLAGAAARHRLTVSIRSP